MQNKILVRIKIIGLNLLILIGLMIPLTALAQHPEIKYELEAQAIGTTNNNVPFWMRSNQFGSIPLTGLSASFIGRVHREYQSSAGPGNSEKKKLIDWGFGFEGRANAGKGSNLMVIEAYGKFRLGIFQLKAGRTRDVMGLNGDTTLSSGNFSVSGNALGVPKVEISIPEYWRAPIFGGIFSIKGNFLHGWLGRERILDKIVQSSTVEYTINNTYPNTYFHQKSLYVRIAKEDWRLKLYGGFNHQVYWGNEQSAYGSNFKLSPFETFTYVVTGRSYGAKGVPTSKIGNQLGSVDLGIEYDFENFNILLYRQNLYDVGALSKLANISDGLNGISIENKQFNKNASPFRWKKILFELFYSKDQAGYPWSKLTKSGDEDYYNNFYYLNGWSYNGFGMGNPLITRKDDAKEGQASNRLDYFINNRVVAYNLGLKGSLYNWDFSTKITYSKNYGTFGTSIYGSSTGVIRNPRTTNIFEPVDQLSIYLEGMRPIKNGYHAGFVTALDQGKLLNNSFGLILRLKKEF